MSGVSVTVLAFATLGLAFFLTWVLRRYALARSVLDIPNERSSHTVPTPRGGGVAIVVSFSLAVTLIAAADLLAWPASYAILSSGILVALIGFLDDHGHIAAGWRLLGNFVAAFLALWWMDGPPPLTVLGRTLDLGLLGWALAALYLAWLLNLYNFMDGIDGIAGIEAVTVCLGGILLGWLALPHEGTWVLPLLLLAAVAGFLCLNFPPAKIFMGDAGSGFLGVTLGVLSLLAAKASPILFWGWVILLGAFVVDATVTLFRRLLRGLRPHEAHRSHAYQYAMRRLRAHRPVSLAVGVINLLWLLPWAAAVVVGWIDGVLGVLCAYLPLTWLAFRLKAGAPDLQEV